MWRKFIQFALHRTNSKRSYSEIDPKIKALVELMNATGCIQTVASCQGHWASGKPPYLYFKCSERIASAIERRLRAVAITRKNGRGFGWTIEAMFNEKFELCFLLYSPKLHQKSNSIIAEIQYVYYAKKLETEFSSLAIEINEAVLPYIREHHKPSVTKKNG